VTTTATAGRTCSRLASEGTKSNRLAIAVRVKVCAKGMTQIRWPSGKLDTLMGCQPVLFRAGRYWRRAWRTYLPHSCTPAAPSPNPQQAPQSLSKPPRGPSVAANLPCNESSSFPLFPEEL